MDFDFSPEQLAFRDEVEAFLDANDDPVVFDVTRENMAQVADIPERRAMMGKIAQQGWLGITWPKEWGGQEGDGVYEYLLNEALARRGGPQIGKGIGIIGKTILRHGSEKMQKEFLPKILRNEIDFAVGYSEPDAGSDAASMKLKATRDGDGWRLNGQKTWTTSAHFAEWYWVGARTDPDAPAPAVSEQAGFEHMMPGHTARYCLALAELSVATGDDAVRRRAVSGFNALTYMQSEPGLFRTMFQLVNEKKNHPNREDWYSQHLYSVCHVLEALPKLPELKGK